MNPKRNNPDPDPIYVPRDPLQPPLPPAAPVNPPRPGQTPTAPYYPVDDPWASSQPHQRYDPLAESRYHEIFLPERKRRRRRLPGIGCCCLALVLPLALVFVLAAYALLPMRTNLLLLGIDSRPGEGNVGRSDTTILLTFDPWTPYVKALSIPRDLWVTVPNAGPGGSPAENRINTAHFFAEASQPGSGPQGAMQTVRMNFGVDVDYYVRVRFDGFRDVIDAMGGVDVNLESPMSGYSQGVHHMSGEQALALVRDRSGSDDFYRMERGHIFLKSVIKQGLKPLTWPRLPQAFIAAARVTDTNLPPWHWPRFAMALLRTGTDDLDTRSITREMVFPFTTSGGAQVLAPNWELINPTLMELFGQ